VRVLVANAGSSSIKLALVDAEAEREEWATELESNSSGVNDDAVAAALTELSAAPDAVGHRVVHGGERFTAPVVLSPEVLTELEELIELAPLHQPKALELVRALLRVLPELPAVACFDTSFHSTLPRAAATYALPKSWRERHGLRRFGFHGLSHAHASRQARRMAPPGARMVTCHLGAGASLCAVHEGRSVDTSMGFTPLEGLPMATRSGSVDPGLLLWLQPREGLSPAEMTEALEHHSGLVGLAGTSDMREVIERAETDPDAALALEVYVHRLRAGVAAMATAMGGLDTLVFTGGVGERAAAVRSLTCAGLAHLGVELDDRRNRDAEPDVEVGTGGAAVRVLVLRAREDLEIARATRTALAGSG
jgi:acetate kinase